MRDEQDQWQVERPMRSALLTVILLFAAAAADAQTIGKDPTSGSLAEALPDGRMRALAAARNFDQLALLLDLDAGQKAQVEAILENERARMDEFAQEAEASGESSNVQKRQAKLTQAQSEAREQLSAVLTDSQLKKFDALERFPRSTGLPTGLHLQTRSVGASCDDPARCTQRDTPEKQPAKRD
jgi:hypothetical protein